MFVSLIGMSNLGKTFWGRKLSSELGFEYWGVDDYIEQQLKPELEELGYEGIQDMSKWLGQPWEEQYSQNSQRYLQLEEEGMRQALELVEKEKVKNLVIDTTGSVGYISEAVLEKMRELTTVVWLKTPEGHQEQMFRQFRENPKPIFWGESFERKEGEGVSQALARCYPELLKVREGMYRRWAEVSLSYEKFGQYENSAQWLREQVEKELGM
jgi:shikimate kinase